MRGSLLAAARYVRAPFLGPESLSGLELAPPAGHSRRPRAALVLSRTSFGRVVYLREVWSVSR